MAWTAAKGFLPVVVQYRGEVLLKHPGDARQVSLRFIAWDLNCAAPGRQASIIPCPKFRI